VSIFETEPSRPRPCFSGRIWAVRMAGLVLC